MNEQFSRFSSSVKKVTAPLFLITILSLYFTVKSQAQSWSILGSEDQISSVASSYTSLCILNNVPYVVYVEGSSSGGIGIVKKRNAAGSWVQVGSNLSTSTISHTRIFHDTNNKLYVTYIDESNDKLCMLYYDSDQDTWEPLILGNINVSGGSATFSAAVANNRNGVAFDADNVPYIAYSERDSIATGTPFVKRFIDGAWETVGGGAVSTDWSAGNDIAIDKSGNIFMIYIKQAASTDKSGQLMAYKYDPTTKGWTDISPASPVSPGSSSSGNITGIRHSCIAIDSAGDPIVSYFNANSSGKATIIKFNETGNLWEYIGTTSTRDAPYECIASDQGGNVYSLFSDALISSGRANMVRLFKLYKGATGFTELHDADLSKGIDSTGPNTTATRDISISNLGLALGSDTSSPFIIYTKTNAAGIATPIVQKFILPVVTDQITDITANSANVSAIVNSDLGEPIIEKGIVYSENQNPTTADQKIINATTNYGTYTAALSNLTPATTYHVRAYATTSTGTSYGNDLLFTTDAPDAGSVVVEDLGSTVIMRNGLVKATIRKSNAEVISLIYNGLELISGGYSGGSIYWSWNMPDYHNPSNCTYTLSVDPHQNNFDYAEIKMEMKWDGSSTAAAMDVTIYYSLPRDASGIYASATLSHPSSYPDLPGGEWRMASYPNPMFDWLSVDSSRNRLMANESDLQNAVAVDGAPKEVSRLTTGIYKDHYECKYDYAADFGSINVWGWSSTANNVGLWVTAPSKEYYPGGPMKTELMCHGTPVLLNMLGGTHFGQGTETDVAAGENWSKTYGPFLIYCNKVPASTADPNIELWKDAKNQALKEQAKWPYSWYTNPAYIQASGRGTVTGKLAITDPGDPEASAADTWVGLAIPPEGASSTTDFQDWSKNFQYWVKTDNEGNFVISNVIPGNYSLFAFGPGAAGQLSLSDYANVQAGSTTALSTVDWTPDRVAPTIWEIGIPNRNASEYKHGKDYWTSNIYPDLRWGKFQNYYQEFPDGVSYTIGQSKTDADWNFVQPYIKDSSSTSPKWDINFDLSDAPITNSTASVYVALAENKGAALILSVNGTNVTSPSTGATFGNGSNSMLRKGVHGAFTDVRFNFPASYLHAGTNTISFTLRLTGGGTQGDLMYDYIRLEAEGTSTLTLPVSLLPLSGHRSGNMNVLSWATASEFNTSSMHVYRSSLGNPNIEIGSVSAAGNSTNYRTYSFTDSNSLAGPNYYDIKVMDKDGKAVYSNVILINVDNANTFTIYPNPVHKNITIKTTLPDGISMVKLYDMRGILLKSTLVNGAQGQIDFSPFPSGIYHLEIQSGKTVIKRSIVKK